MNLVKTSVLVIVRVARTGDMTSVTNSVSVAITMVVTDPVKSDSSPNIDLVLMGENSVVELLPRGNLWLTSGRWASSPYEAGSGLGRMIVVQLGLLSESVRLKGEDTIQY